jgi:putative toxin-antitoxin system antitoxin component (TIGR02293 family)
LVIKNKEQENGYLKYSKELEPLMVSKAAASSYVRFLSSRISKIHSIRKGIPYYLFDMIRTLAPFGDDEQASFLDISLKSLQRYRKDNMHVFKSSHTEKILEIAVVVHLGNDVFNNKEHFYTWCTRINPSLSYMTPLDLMSDSYCKELVTNELHRIAHGIFA